MIEMSRAQAKAATMEILEPVGFRATGIAFVPGDKTAWRGHAMDPVLVPDCVELPHGPQGRRRVAGVEQDAINRDGGPMTFVEVELK